MILAPNSGDSGVQLVETNQKELAKKYGIERFEKPYPDSGIKHIGLNPQTGTWYGWSHRAIYGFTVGATVKKGDVIATTAEWPWGEGSNGDHEQFEPGFTAKTLDDARRMAAAFARAVS
jgi:hypothetical protein